MFCVVGWFLKSEIPDLCVCWIACGSESLGDEPRMRWKSCTIREVYAVGPQLGGNFLYSN